jgi:hypothetical protein
MGNTILGGLPESASPSDPGPEESRAVIDRELYGLDHPAPKEMFSAEVALREPSRDGCHPLQGWVDPDQALRAKQASKQRPPPPSRVPKTWPVGLRTITAPITAARLTSSPPVVYRTQIAP